MRQAKLTSIGILSLSIVIMLSLVQPKLPFATLISAQAQACTDVVKQALDAAVKVCNELGRNKVCYVNGALTAQPKEGITDFTFNNPGDVVAIKDLGTLQAAPYNETEGTWGVAMLRVQASLPGTNVGQGVTMLAFGDTQITDASTDGTLNAFYLQTGVGAPGCAEMPRNGVLLNSPTGEKVNMTVNGVELKIGSTVFMYADTTEGQQTGNLWLHTLEGSVEMSANGKTVTVPAGKEACVPMNGDAPDDVPCEPTDDAQQATGGLPTDTLTTLSDTPPSDATPAVTDEPTAVPTRVNTAVPTAVPTNPPPVNTPVPPRPTAVPTAIPTEDVGDNSNTPPSNCRIDSFTANPTSAYFGQDVQLAWSSSGAINFVQMIDPNGNTNEAAAADTRSYTFGSYQEGLPEGWTLQVFCTDETTQTAGVTVNPAIPPTEPVQPPEQATGSSSANSTNGNQ